MDQVKFVEDTFKNFEEAYSADTITPSMFLKAVFHKFYMVHFWILCLK